MNQEQTSELNVIDLGRAAYRPVLSLQKQMHRERVEGERPDTLLYVEHEPVYTLGKSAEEEHLLAPRSELEQNGFDVVVIGRGGDVTYHGPGQIVGYPVFDLRDHRRSVSWYMRTLEEAIIRTLSTYGLDPARDEDHPGVWIGEEKICAVGVRIKRWTTFHGFALNVDPNMDHFGGIVPCGIRNRGVTSMANLLSESPERKEVKQRLTDAFRSCFSFDGVVAGNAVEF